MKVIKVALVFVCLLSTNLKAQNEDSLEVDLQSPYQTVLTHLKFLQEESYSPDKAAAVFNPEYFDRDEARRLAIELKQVLDGKGLYIELEDVPKQRNYQDTLTFKYRYILVADYPDIYVEKQGDLWYYSRRTADVIAGYHDEVYPFGTLPKMGSTKYFGLYIWQYIGILILVGASFLIHKVLTFLLDRLITRVLFRAGYKEVARRFIVPVARPLSIFFVFLLLRLFEPMLQLPIKTSQYTVLAINALLPFFATWVFYKGADLVGLYFQKLASKTESTLDDQLVPLIRKILKSFVIIIGGLVILQNLQIPILPFLTGLSIGGLAFALAAQDTVKNFFGSVMIFIDKPFQIGDWITTGEIDGTVEEVGIRSTRVRTFRDSVVYVPNGNLANATVDNHGLRVYRRFYTLIAINYDTPPDLIELYVEGLRRMVEAHPHTRKDYFEIHLNEMADSSLNIMFYIFFKVPSWSDELTCRHEIIMSIIRLAEEIGINFAFPTQTLHVENLPGQDSLSPQYLDIAQARKQMDQHLAKDQGQSPE